MKIPLSDYRAMNKINRIAENIQAIRDTPIVEIEYRVGTCETLIPAPTTSKSPKPRRKRK